LIERDKIAFSTKTPAPYYGYHLKRFT
jgi:hypothetical protein